MKTISLLLLAMFSFAAGAATTTGAYQSTCKSTSGECPPPPAPPIPPTPPTPPMPPMPPAAPPMPAIPAEAHAACAGKRAGATLTYVISKRETMTGTCQSEGGKMLFILHSYSIED